MKNNKFDIRENVKIKDEKNNKTEKDMADEEIKMIIRAQRIRMRVRRG